MAPVVAPVTLPTLAENILYVPIIGYSRITLGCFTNVYTLANINTELRYWRAYAEHVMIPSLVE